MTLSKKARKAIDQVKKRNEDGVMDRVDADLPELEPADVGRTIAVFFPAVEDDTEEGGKENPES
jgi:hypothetical protein